MGIELPTGIQQVLDNNDFGGANNGPVIPGTGMPVAPLQPLPAPPAPDIQPEHPIDKLANAFISHLIEKDKAAQPPRPAGDGTGSFADKLRSAGNAVGASLGDASHAADGLKPGQGALSGVMNTLEARHTRMAQEKKDQILNAKNSFESAVLNQRLKNETQEYQDRSNAQNGAHTKQLETEEGFAVEHGVTESDLMNRRRDFKVGEDGKHFDDVYDHIQTGSINVNGKSTPTYDIVTLKNEPVTLSDADRSSIKAGGGPDLPENTKVSYGARRQMMLQSQGVLLVRNALEKANDEALTADQKRAVNSASRNPAVQAAVTRHPEDPLADLVHDLGAATTNLGTAKTHLDAAKQHGTPDDVAKATATLKQAQAEHDDLQTVLVNGINSGKMEELHTKRLAELAAKQKEDEAERKEDEVIRHNKREEEIQDKRADIQAQKETQQKGLGDSYKTENKEFDLVRKPLSTSLDAFSTLRNSLDQGTAVGDSVVAPALLKALVAGGGVRITQAEINNFQHGRSTVEDMKAVLQKMSSGKSITQVQRAQVYDLLGAVESKVRAKNDILNDAQESLDGAQTIADQRKAVSDARRKLDAVDSGQSVTPSQQTKTTTTNTQPSQSAGIPTGAVTAVGQGGHKIYTVDSGKTWIDSVSGQPLPKGN